MAQGSGLVGNAILSAQVQVGVTAGVPVTSPILDRQTSNRFGFSRVDSAARRYTLGPSLEFPIAGPLTIETGFLYKRFGFDSNSRGGQFISGPYTEIVSSTTGNAWEFPLLAKSRLRLTSRTHITLAAGPVLRRITGVRETGKRTSITFFPPPGTRETEPLDTTSPASFDRRTSIGGAIGAGVEFSAGALRLTPGVRLTYWDTERTSSTSSGSRLNRTQFDALLNIAYAQNDAAPAALPRAPGSFEFGLLAGVPLLNTYERTERDFIILVPNTFDAPTRRFAAGAYVTWHFHPRYSLEGSFLTRRFGHSEFTYYAEQTSVSIVRGYAWEAPLMMKVRMAPLVFGLGPAIRRASHAEWAVGTTRAPLFEIPWSVPNRTTFGIAASGGVEFAFGRMRLRPELRFSWYGRPLYEFSGIRTRQDSLLFVLALGADTK
jgi:outer membrane protein with beta-barrel domain